MSNKKQIVFENDIKIRLSELSKINKSIIRSNVTIYHNTTMGSKQFGNKKGVPTIEDNVIIYPNSCLLGKITIGKNAIIGADSIVFSDVEKNTIVAGNLAREVGDIVDNKAMEEIK